MSRMNITRNITVTSATRDSIRIRTKGLDERTWTMTKDNRGELSCFATCLEHPGLRPPSSVELKVN
ncbi:hypothetical protein EJB05_53654, partial [Eragrostis curvula]